MASIVISLISGIVLALAFPRANLDWVAWFTLAPLMYYVFRRPWKDVLLCGFAFGMGFFGVLLYWIGVFGKLPWFVLAVFQGLYVVGFVMLAKLIGTRLGPWGRFILMPSLWVSIEWVRSLGMMAFTWGDLGYSQYRALPMIQIASITGVRGISYLIVLANSALANLAIARKTRSGLSAAHAQFFIVLALMIGTVVYGLAVLSRPLPEGDRVRVAVIQGDINQDRKLTTEYVQSAWDVYSSLTRQAGTQGVDLIVWPETVVPGRPRYDFFALHRLAGLADVTGAKLLVGGWDEDALGKVYNSVFLIGPKPEIIGSYAKVHLVPFGEFVPLRKHLPFLSRYHVTAYDTSPGTDFSTIDAGQHRIGTAICFESIFPLISRTMTARGANLLCVVTNDCWYDWTAAAEQHMSFAVFRAVENRRWLVRGASTGISCVIDPCGRIVSRIGAHRSGIVSAEVHTLSGLTPYTRAGDWVVWLSLVFILILVLARPRGKGTSRLPQAFHAVRVIACVPATRLRQFSLIETQPSRGARDPAEGGQRLRLPSDRRVRQD